MAIALRQLDARRPFRIEHLEQRSLLRVIGLRGIAGGRANALIFLGEEINRAQRLVLGITPELAAHALVHVLSESFGKPVRQRLDHDLRVVIVGARKALGNGFLADPRRDRKPADVVG